MFSVIKIRCKIALDAFILGFVPVLFNFIFMIVVIHISDKLSYAIDTPVKVP